MIPLLEATALKLHERYTKILNNYYPAHNGTGFTERNLSHNFVASLEEVLGFGHLSWFEAPIDIKKKKHLDAVVFDIHRKISFLIESKRFSDVTNKIKSVKNDIVRMQSPAHIELLEKGLININIENRYAIVLVDVWTETKSKQTLLNTWPECIGNDQIMWSKSVSFENLTTKGKWKYNYNILMAAIEI